MLCPDGLKVASENVKYTDDAIEAKYEYNTTVVREGADGKMEVAPEKHTYEFRTKAKVPKLGVMLVGWGGNNGTTVTAGVIANREGICWRTKVSRHCRRRGAAGRARPRPLHPSRARSPARSVPSLRSIAAAARRPARRALHACPPTPLVSRESDVEDVHRGVFRAAAGARVAAPPPALPHASLTVASF